MSLLNLCTLSTRPAQNFLFLGLLTSSSMGCLNLTTCTIKLVQNFAKRILKNLCSLPRAPHLLHNGLGVLQLDGVPPVEQDKVLLLKVNKRKATQIKVNDAVEDDLPCSRPFLLKRPLTCFRRGSGSSLLLSQSTNVALTRCPVG